MEAGSFTFWMLASVAANVLLLALLAATLRRLWLTSGASRSPHGTAGADPAASMSEVHGSCAEPQAGTLSQAELISRMAAANHAAGIVMWHCDFKTRMLYSLPGVTAIWGGQPFSIDEFETRFVHPEDLEGYRKAFHVIGIDIESVQHRHRVVLPDGRILHMQVHACPVRSAQGQVIGMVGAQLDVTEQVGTAHQIDQQARELEIVQQRLVRATTATQDALVEMEFATGVVWTSPRMNEMLGYEPHEDIGITAQNFHDIVHEEDRAQIASLQHRKIIYEGTAYELEYRLRKRDGSYLWSRFRGRAELDSHGIPVRTSGSVQDITVELAAREAKEAAIFAAESANRAKSTFLATVSHEIRTPISGIIGMATLLQETALDRVQRDYADTVKSSADSLLTILNDILDFSKIEAGKLAIEELDYDLHEQVDAVGALLAFTAAKKGIELIVNVHPDAPDRVIGDPQRLRQCLLNMAGNAIKFTQHGEVSVTVRPIAGTDALRFEVKDTGIGISREALSNLFQPFAQADTSTSRKFGGTGLGLSIVRRLAELMGGEVGANSTMGEGSLFWLQLPLRRASPPRIRVEDFPVMARVLGIDGNATVRSMLSLQLRALGYESHTASDLNEAATLLAKNHSRPYNVILLDYRLSRTDGAGLLDGLRAEQALAPTRIIALTRVDDIAEMHEIGALGFAAYVSKPCKQRELAGCLERVLQTSDADITAGTLAQGAGTPTDTHCFAGKVLLAEDNPVNQRVALKFLERLGCDAEAVADGESAVARVEEQTYSLVLMDMQMPGIDGIEATRRIRAREPAGCHIPIVALTANVMPEQIRECRIAGMDDHLSKPLDIERLRTVLRKFMTGGISHDKMTASGGARACKTSESSRR